MRRVLAVLVVAVLGVLGAGCGSNNKQPSQYNQVKKHAAKQRAYLPQNDVELHNYNDAQKLYDSPSTIIWCTTTWGNASAPLVTVPVAGKLTSSSTTFFNPTDFAFSGDSGITTFTARSVDGLFHPNPPPYRYGFTPGGQYVDFFNMPTLCTTALSKFQRQVTRVSIAPDPAAAHATSGAEAALRAGQQSNGTITRQAKEQAQRILEGANLGG